MSVVAPVRNVRIVPLGGVDPETVAELAHGLKRRGHGKVEILAPRRLRGSDPTTSLERPDATGTVTLGVTRDEGDEPRLSADPTRAVGVITLPLRRAGQTAARAVDMALALLAG